MEFELIFWKTFKEFHNNNKNQLWKPSRHFEFSHWFQRRDFKSRFLEHQKRRIRSKYKNDNSDLNKFLQCKIWILVLLTKILVKKNWTDVFHHDKESSQPFSSSKSAVFLWLLVGWADRKIGHEGLKSLCWLPQWYFSNWLRWWLSSWLR